MKKKVCSNNDNATTFVDAPTSSVYSERLFSETGNVYEPKKNHWIMNQLAFQAIPNHSKTGEKSLFTHNNNNLFEVLSPCTETECTGDCLAASLEFMILDEYVEKRQAGGSPDIFRVFNKPKKMATLDEDHNESGSMKLLAKYSIGQEIGEGAGGNVFEGKYCSNRKP